MSNLTNPLAFQASGLTFTRFGALMLLLWLVALGMDWVVIGRMFAGDLEQRAVPTADAYRPVDMPLVAPR